ncbi:MAG: FliM/FliN family flagellar motor switch protein [Acidobacteria bacterium]|nr:FliM/FliN family flagellar motor switch protein [Acidobacteriota bacterium]
MSESEKSEKTNGHHSVMDEAKDFMDVPVRITVQLASCNMKIRDILQLRENSIVEMPKSAGENVDVLVNNRLIAGGEVLELEGTTGVRLTDFNVIL